MPKQPRKQIKVGKDVYQPLVLLINTKDEFGRPKLVTAIHDDNSISLAGGEEFLVVYAPAHMLWKKGKN